MNTTTSVTGTRRDERLDAGHRAELLLREMTTAEKCHQLATCRPGASSSVERCTSVVHRECEVRCSVVRRGEDHPPSTGPRGNGASSTGRTSGAMTNV